MTPMATPPATRCSARPPSGSRPDGIAQARKDAREPTGWSMRREGGMPRSFRGERLANHAAGLTRPGRPHRISAHRLGVSGKGGCPANTAQASPRKAEKLSACQAPLPRRVCTSPHGSVASRFGRRLPAL